MATRERDQWIVTPEWQAKVRRELAARARGAQAAMQRAIGAKPSTVNELLRDGARRSHLVAAVHEYFGWPPPSSPITATTIENRALVSALTDEQRAVVDFVLDLLLRDPSADNTKAFMELVATFRKAQEMNRHVRISNLIVIDSDGASQTRPRRSKR